MEDTNRLEDSIKVVWEVLPGDRSHIFREICREDIDPSLFSTGSLISKNNFPTIPHPIFDLADDCLDRVWTQTVIQIKTDVITQSPKKIQENTRAFNVKENNKGLLCPFNSSRCQEGWCQGCIIYLDKPL